MKISKSVGVLPAGNLQLEETQMRLGGVHQKRIRLVDSDLLENQTAAFSYETFKILQEKSAFLDLGFLAHASTTPDGISPATAHRLHRLAGLAQNVHCFDLASSCSSYLSGLRLLENLVDVSEKSALLFATERKSVHLRPGDKVTESLFADGSFASFLEPSKGPFGDIFHWLSPYVDSSLCDNIQVKREADSDYLKMSNGKLMFRRIVQALSVLVKQGIDAAGERGLQLGSVYIHQANVNILAEVQKAFPHQRIPSLISDIGNLVSASMPLHRIRCLMLDSIFFDLYKNHKKKDVNLIFDRENLFLYMKNHSDRFRLQIGCKTDDYFSQVIFTLKNDFENVVLLDSGAQNLNDSWLAKISHSEWNLYFETLLNHTRESAQTINHCDLWIVAGGGFQALGLLHKRCFSESKPVVQ